MRAAELVSYLRNPRNRVHAELLSTSMQGDAEVVEFEVDVDLPQRPIFPINPIERIRVQFPAGDAMPAVLVVRDDFPRVPHLVLGPNEFPRQLCIYERAWGDEKHNWSPRSFVERIRAWLRGTADGTLHPRDQPMEPILPHSAGSLVLPSLAFDSARRAWVDRFYFTQTCEFLVAHRRRPPGADRPLVPVLFLQGSTGQHGIMHRVPATLADLESIMASMGQSLVGSIAQEISKVRTELVGAKGLPLLLVLELPKCRDRDGNVELVERQAFIIGGRGADILNEEVVTVEKGGIWVPEKRLAIEDPTRLKDQPLILLSVRYHLEPRFAAAMNGHSYTPVEVVAIGAGAVGSQVANNLWRGGFGLWTVIDDDNFEPHNPARHLSGSHAVGANKAEALSIELAGVFADEAAPAWVAANYLQPALKAPDVAAAMRAAKLVIDFSASVPVERKLAGDQNTNARRASAFLNQRGDESIVLLEDVDRGVNLIWLEAEYMRAVAFDPRLAGHFDDVKRVAHRYGNGCRDISATVAQDAVAIHSGLMAAELRRATELPGATVSIHRWSREAGGVASVRLETAVPMTGSVQSWKILLHPVVVGELCLLRASKLPNETGGVLLGLVDRTHRYVAVVGFLPAPPDSEVWPTSFIRGSAGLAAQVEKISRRTLGNVGYVGEWHSHPAGHNATPSRDDAAAIEICSTDTRADGLPALMLIVADGELAIFLKPTDEEHTYLLKLLLHVET